MNTSDTALDFSTILASSAHDIKNSLAILLGSLSEFDTQCQPSNGPCKELLLRARREGERVNRDLIQLLTLYRIEKSSYFINPSEIILNDFLEGILTEHQALLASHNIYLEVDDKTGASGYFDEDLITGIINTVISNAHRYTEDSILIKSYIENGFLVLSVLDNGPGYPDALLKSWEKMQKGIDFATGSTGLGFYFASRVASLHKNKDNFGQIRISNDGINKGACFSIYLP